MTEFMLLSAFLAVAFVFAPLMTNKFFLNESKDYAITHKVSLFILLVGAVLDIKFLFVAWPLFCIFGVLLFLKSTRKFIFSFNGFAAGIPFLFSLISATWFIAGSFDLKLLGYNRAWSFYAALHGSFLGWLFVGCLVFLSRKAPFIKIRSVYFWACYLSLLLFLCVAFGIDGVPYLKRIGVIGLSALVPFMIGFYIFNLNKKHRLSLLLSGLSLISIVASMVFALLNEFWIAFPRVAFGVPLMVLVHGFLNAVLVVPLFYLAIRMEQEEIVDHF